MRKTIKLVFEDAEEKHADGTQHFRVYAEGFEPERDRLPEKELTAAEFWAHKIFQIVQDLLEYAGVIKRVTTKDQVKKEMS